MTEQTDDAKAAALRSDIERTREELGETVEALAAKADVKARAREKVDDVKVRAQEQVEQAKEAAKDKAERLAQSTGDLMQELRTEPAVPARRAALGVRDSVRDNPQRWVAVAAVALVVVYLVRRRRRV